MINSALSHEEQEMNNSLQALLTGLIDYAGLFPPAALTMETAVRHYAEYLQAEHSWMLGRFIVPMNRLDEFERAATPLLPKGNPVQPWHISALAGSDLTTDLNRIGDFNYLHATDENAGAAVIDAVELKATKADEIRRAMRLLPRSLASYFEIPVTADPTELVLALAQTGALAKVRTGGVNAQAFPSTTDLARFISACAAERVAFKATAGLHHPLRAIYRLTYEPDSELAVMHGFLNVFLAAAFARFGLSDDGIRELLEETSPAAFRFDGEGIIWRTHELTLQRIEVVRHTFAMGYGSCSFDEPIADLRKIGLM